MHVCFIALKNDGCVPGTVHSQTERARAFMHMHAGAHPTPNAG